MIHQTLFHLSLFFLSFLNDKFFGVSQCFDFLVKSCKQLDGIDYNLLYDSVFSFEKRWKIIQFFFMIFYELLEPVFELISFPAKINTDFTNFWFKIIDCINQLQSNARCTKVLASYWVSCWCQGWADLFITADWHLGIPAILLFGHNFILFINSTRPYF